MSNDGREGQPTLQQQVAILKQQLAQAQKLTAIGELVSTTTHEFNNVLMTIINYAKLGLRQTDPASREKAFEKILAAGNRAAKITTGVLGFARNRSSGFEPTDLGRVVDDSLMLLEKEMSKYRIRVEKQIEAVPTAWANGNQIQQVLLNLLINARQAMSNGGLLVVTAAPASLPRRCERSSIRSSPRNPVLTRAAKGARGSGWPCAATSSSRTTAGFASIARPGAARPSRSSSPQNGRRRIRRNRRRLDYKRRLRRPPKRDRSLSMPRLASTAAAFC
jgi:hypothetical protein